MYTYGYNQNIDILDVLEKIVNFLKEYYIFIICAYVVALLLSLVLASTYNRSTIGSILLSFFVTPFVALAVVLLLGKNSQEAYDRKNEHIFYCENCGNMALEKKRYKNNCRACSMPLKETNVYMLEWLNYSDEVREEIKKEIKEGKYSK